MPIGESIEKLIQLNIEIWHEASKSKDINGNLLKDKLSPKERVKSALKIRELNAQRSEIRWEIDKPFDCGANETKINVYREGKC